MKSLAAYASQVKNDVLGGLAATANFPISLEQIKDTLISMRARALEEVQTGKIQVQNLMGFYQLIPKLPLTLGPDKIHYEGIIPPLISITKFNPIKYFGMPLFRKPYRVKFDHRYTMGADIRTSHIPVVYIDTNFKFEILVSDCNDNPEKGLSIEAVFSNPRDVRKFGCVYDDEDTFFPMPERLADMIVGKLTNDYLRNYQRANPQPNTGTMIMNPTAAGPTSNAQE